MDDQLPFFVTAPGETDIMLGAIGALLLVLLLGLGALYFTVQAIPDRMAAGSHKVQMQLVGILGVLSLFTMNNAFWIAGLLLAAIPFHELFPAQAHSDAGTDVIPDIGVTDTEDIAQEDAEAPVSESEEPEVRDA